MLKGYDIFMIGKKVINALKAVSHGTSDIKKNYQNIRNMRRFSMPFADSIHKGYIFADGKIKNIPVRLFCPDNLINNDIIIYFHGGGWVIGDIESYSSVCSTMCLKTSRRVLAVEYALAPEYKFPYGLNQAYEVVQAVITHTDELNVNAEKVILAGDSAGGNISASVNLMAYDKGQPCSDKQILLYPVTYYDYTETSPYQSVHRFKNEYFLTAQLMNDYAEMYSSCKEDFKNPYFSPVLHKQPLDQPDTLIITAEYDILRDEGEEFGRNLEKHGCNVVMHCVKDSLHGFIVLPLKFSIVNEAYECIGKFLDGGCEI